MQRFEDNEKSRIRLERASRELNANPSNELVFAVLTGDIAEDNGEGEGVGKYGVRSARKGL